MVAFVVGSRVFLPRLAPSNTRAGDFIHLHIEYHAKALETFSEMYREHDGIHPDNIEEIVGLQKTRPALDNI